MSTFFNLTPEAAFIPTTGKGLVQGFAEGIGPGLDARRSAMADANQWRDTVSAFPESAGGFTRAQMFALGRDPAMRKVAVEMLTGRMRPDQFASPAPQRPRSPAPAFAPSRMATDADYQTRHNGANFPPSYWPGWPAR